MFIDLSLTVKNLFKLNNRQNTHNSINQIATPTHSYVRSANWDNLENRPKVSDTKLELSHTTHKLRVLSDKVQIKLAVVVTSFRNRF